MGKMKTTVRLRAVIAGILALIMIALPILSGLPAIEAYAAGEKIWYHVKAGSGNGNSHEYSNVSSGPAAVLLHKTETMPKDGELSLTYQKMGTPAHARLGFFYTYQDDGNWLFIGCNPGGNWFYQYMLDGAGSWPELTSLDLQNDDSEVKVSVSVNREVLQVKVNDSVQNVNNKDLDTLMNKIDGKGKFGFRAAKYSDEWTEFRFTNVKVNGQEASGDWGFLADCAGQLFEEEEPIPTYSVSGEVRDADGQAIPGAKIRVGGETGTAMEDGSFSIPGVEAGEYVLSVSAKGYVSTSQKLKLNEDKDLGTIVLTLKGNVEYDTFIESDQIKAAVSKTFPQAMQYTMKTGEMAGAKFAGQEDPLSVITINGTEIVPEVAEPVLEKESAVYVMDVKNQEKEIDLQMTVKISVSENDLTWEVTDITKREGCVKINSIEVPDLNLVTVTDDLEDAQFMGANNSGNVNESGDEKISFEKGFAADQKKGYSYGFVSGNGLSAGLWSNSEAANDRRVLRSNGANSMSLNSNVWYYEYGDLERAAEFAGTPISELPCAKICLTGDENEDGTADWQDGAIAYRDIMNMPQDAESVPDLVNYRIVMNFASQATNPYLKTADNIKKVYLATDGLPQAVMLKGYGNEGHDSANSEYGDIGERTGGLEEYKKLIQIAHDYNTQMGIHVNAQEMYTESRSYTDELTDFNWGWGWLDQSYTIDRVYDMGTKLRYKRFLQLFDRMNGTQLYKNQWPGVVGQADEAEEKIASPEEIGAAVKKAASDGTNLDFIYLDVWYGDSWETRKIAQEINSLGWRFTTEFGTTGEYDSTWQHWATESKYGGSTGKGHNSDVRRFIRNHTTDSFVSNIPGYGGTADNPLLGGFDLNGFEGWGSNSNFDEYINTTFTVNLPTKFLQHYEVVKWENYPVDEAGKSTSPTGNHEKEITLKNDAGDTVVVTRKDQQRSDEYVERTITLNGKKVLDDVTYLLPWMDEETGEEKLYHWNYDGGTTTWDLSDEWKNVSSVVVYPVSDQGRGEGQTLDIADGRITLEAEPQTVYIVVKRDEAPRTVIYGEMNYVSDPGFNSYAGIGDGTPLDAQVWSRDVTEDSVKVRRMSSGNQYLVMDSPQKEVAVSTQITGLIPGKEYVAQVYVDNRSAAKASIEVTGGEKTVSNYTLESLAENYVSADAHDKNALAGSRMQIMLVSFTAASDRATLTLKRAEGEGATYFDDLRIIDKKLGNFKEDGSFIQDFESVAQGLYPFVLGPAQGVTDPCTHLSQDNAPYTDSGYRDKLLDDVIDGEWSLKHHSLNTGIIYRTIPQTFRFEAGKSYKVSFDYQNGSDNAYAITTGVGEDTTEVLSYLKSTLAPAQGERSSTEHFSFTINGDQSGQSWFGLYSNGSQTDGRMGHYDFILDNLVIKEIPIAMPQGNIEVTDLKEPVKAEVTVEEGVELENGISWSSSDENIAAVDEEGVVTFYDYGAVTVTAMAVADGEEISVSCEVTLKKEILEKQKGQFAAVYANTEDVGNPAGNVMDGDSSTIWHTRWQGSGFTVSEENPALLTLELKEDAKAYNGFRILQRSDNVNGRIEKLQYVVGNNFDTATNEITDGTVSETLEAAGLSENGWVNVDLPRDVCGKYIQIRILKGGNSFGAAAEVETYQKISYATAENNLALAKNKLAKAERELADTLLEVEDLKEKVKNQEVQEEALREAVKQANEAAARAEEAKEQVQEALDKVEAEKDQAKTELEKAKAEAEKARAEAAKAKAEAEKAKEEAKKAEAEAEKAETEAAKAKAQAEKAKADTEKAKADIEKAKAEAQRKIEEAKQARTEAERAKAELEKAAAEAKRLEQELEAAKKALEEQQSKLKQGDSATYQNVTYKVLDPLAKTAVAVKGKNVSNITIAGTVRIKGITCKVTEIADKAFKNARKLSKVTIGVNVEHIGKQAFYQAKKLKAVIIKSKRLESVGSKAFIKTAAKVKISVPKGKRASYKNMLKGKVPKKA